MAKTTLTISSKNYSSWSLRGWLLAKFSSLDFEEIVTAPDDPSARAEILLLSSSILVPCLRHEAPPSGIRWRLRNISTKYARCGPAAG
jgi:glutathione S-transferase